MTNLYGVTAYSVHFSVKNGAVYSCPKNRHMSSPINLLLRFSGEHLCHKYSQPILLSCKSATTYLYGGTFSFI